MVLTTREEHTKAPSISKKKQLTTTTLGLLFLTLSILSMVTDPVLMIVKYAIKSICLVGPKYITDEKKDVITLSTPSETLVEHCFRVAPGSYVLGIMESEVEGARLSITLFNITNADRFMSGEDYKLKLNEVGPFTYVEKRKNIDVVLNMDGGLMHVTPSIKLVFLPEESIAHPEDINVTVANTVLLSATSLLRPYPFLVQQAFNILANQYRSKSIVTVSAQTYLWGLEDPIIKLASRVAPGLIFFDKLGIMDRLYDDKSYFRLEAGITNEDKFSIKSLERRLKNTSTDYPPIERYTFNDTYEGIGYRADIKRSTPIHIYRLGVCKTFELGFERKVTMDYGPEAWIYRITNDTFNRDCIGEDNCGLIDLAPCLYGIPLALSRTHFLYSDPKLYERIEGLKPDKKIHDSMFVIDPKVGFELETSLSIQINLMLEDVRFNREARPFSNLVVPIAHLKVTQPELFEEIKQGLKFLHVIAPVLMICLQVIITTVAIILLVYSIRHIQWIRPPATKDALTVVGEKQMLPLITCNNQ